MDWPEPNLFTTLEFFIPQESNVVDDTHLTNLEEVFDPPFTSFLITVPSFSSTPMDTTISDLTLPASPFPLAQHTGLEMGKISMGDTRSIEDDWLG